VLENIARHVAARATQIVTHGVVRWGHGGGPIFRAEFVNTSIIRKCCLILLICVMCNLN
jgi:hypothetical protein